MASLLRRAAGFLGRESVEKGVLAAERGALRESAITTRAATTSLRASEAGRATTFVGRNKGKIALGGALAAGGSACYYGMFETCGIEDPGPPWVKGTDADGNTIYTNSDTGVSVSHVSAHDMHWSPLDPMTYISSLFHLPNMAIILRAAAVGVGGGLALKLLLRDKAGTVVCLVIPVAAEYMIERFFNEQHSVISSGVAAVGGYVACSVV